jgi:hypothetical protein
VHAPLSKGGHGKLVVHDAGRYLSEFRDNYIARSDSSRRTAARGPLK